MKGPGEAMVAVAFSPAYECEATEVQRSAAQITLEK